MTLYFKIASVIYKQDYEFKYPSCSLPSSFIAFSVWADLLLLQVYFTFLYDKPAFCIYDGKTQIVLQYSSKRHSVYIDPKMSFLHNRLLKCKSLYFQTMIQAMLAICCRHTHHKITKIRSIKAERRKTFFETIKRLKWVNRSS